MNGQSNRIVGDYGTKVHRILSIVKIFVDCIRTPVCVKSYVGFPGALSAVVADYTVICILISDRMTFLISQLRRVFRLAMIARSASGGPRIAATCPSPWPTSATLFFVSQAFISWLQSTSFSVGWSAPNSLLPSLGALNCGIRRSVSPSSADDKPDELADG